MEGGSIPTLSNLEDAMKAEQKVPCLQLCICTLIQTVSYNHKLIYDWWNSNRTHNGNSMVFGKAIFCNKWYFRFFLHALGSSWYCKKKEEIRVEKAVCRLGINKAKSSWFWCKELGNSSLRDSRTLHYLLAVKAWFLGFLKSCGNSLHSHHEDNTMEIIILQNSNVTRDDVLVC